MHTVTLEEAQAHLSELLDEVQQGEEVLIVRDGAKENDHGNRPAGHECNQ